MCRLLGIVCDEAVNFRVMLKEAPRSLRTLAREHPHGWGIAVHAPANGWRIEKSPESALEDDRFHDVALESTGMTLIAHVRQRTVGSLSHDNTHPFSRAGWVFCHNGTIEDLDFLRRSASPARLAEVTGDTDSELLLAYLLSRVEADADLSVADDRFDRALLRATQEVTDRPGFGACNYLLSNGPVVYAHRFGRTLHLLERERGDPVRQTRVSQETGAVIETPWSERRHALLVASEAMTPEPWRALDERTLLRIDREPVPGYRVLSSPATLTAA